MTDQIIPMPRGRPGIPRRLLAFLEQLPLDKAYEVIVRPHVRKRSNEQNRYWYGVVVKIVSDFTGYEKDEAHSLLLGEHFGWVAKRVPVTPNNPRGIADVPRRTTTTDELGQPSTLNKIEFMDLVDFAQRYMAKQGVYIPNPDEYLAEATQQKAVA